SAVGASRPRTGERRDYRRAFAGTGTLMWKMPIMGWLAFIASLVRSLAWPVAVVVLVIVLRKQLAALFAGLAARLADLGKLSAMGVDLEFETRVEEVARDAEQLAPPPEKPLPAAESDVLDLARQMADVAPRPAVVTAFANVEGALRQAAKRALGSDAAAPA